MADITNLASFDFDSDRLMKGIEEMQKKLFELAQSQQNLSRQTRDLNKEIEVQERAMKVLADNAQQDTKQYKELEKSIGSMRWQQEQLFVSTKNTQRERSVLNAEYNKAVKIQNVLTTSEGKTLSIQEAINEALSQEVNTREEARAANARLNKIKDQLNVNNAEEAALIGQLNQRVNQNNDLLKESGSEREKQVSNVGNYTNSIIDAYRALEKEKEALEGSKKELQETIKETEKGTDEYKLMSQQLNVLDGQIESVAEEMSKAKGEAEGTANATDLLNGGLGGLIQQSQTAGGATQLLGNTLKGVTTGIVSMTRAALAFIATPIGAVLAVIAGAFLLVQNALSRSEESTNKLKTAIAPLTGIFRGVLKVLEPLGEFIIDGIVRGFEMATDAIQTTVKAVSAGLKMLGFDSASQSVMNFSNAMDNAITSSKELALAEQDLEKAQRKSRLTQLQYQKEAENFRQIRDDESRTIQERITANEQLGEVLNRQLQEEMRLAEVALKVANLRIQQEGKTKEALDAQFAALTEIADIEERINGQRSEQLTNINSLRREAQSQQKAAHDERMKQIDAEIAKQKEQLDLWIAQQGDRARTIEEQLNLEQQISQRSLAILDNELKNKKISQENYELEVLKLKQNTAKLQAEIAVQLAEDNLQAYINENNSRIANGQLLTDELLQQEIDRNKALQAERDSFAKTQFDNGLINQRDYDQALLENQRVFLETENSLKAQNAADNREIQNTLRAAEFEAQLIQLQENLASEFEIRKAQSDFEYEDQKLQLEQQRADSLITEEMYQSQLDNITATHAQVRKQIEADVQNAKLSLTRDVFSGVAELVGEQTAMGKAAGIATATINTYQGVSEVWKSPAVFPEPINTILKAVQTGITVASGLAAVKKISSVKTPKVKGYATGGIISGGFGINRSNGDDVLITAKRGEAILNERQQSFIGRDLLSFAGVPGFATGGRVGVPASSLTSVQNSVFGNQNNINMDEFVTRIETAVENGSQTGSQQGTTVGSQQGISQLSQDRIAQSNSYLQ